MTIQQTLTSTGLPCAYSHFKKSVTPPYLVYIGRGQTVLGADNTWVYTNNQYQIEYYFTEKNEANEKAIEEALLLGGFNYDKSEDAFIESEGLFVIYYYV